MKRFLNLVVAVALSMSTAVFAQYDYLYEDMPFDMPKVNEPQIPQRSVSLDEFGAKGDGVTLCTDAFAKAIAELSRQGGGTLVVPQGVWYTGPIMLQSRINLHLAAGAIILFTEDYTKYPTVETIYEGKTAKKCQSPITAIDCEDVAITGSGVIDGNGMYWRPLKKPKTNSSQWDKITAFGGSIDEKGSLWTPDDNRQHLRPNLIKFVNCRRVMFKDVTFKNSPAWNVHPVMCQDIIVDGVKILNPSYAQNGDGIDIESCSRVIMVNSTLDVGDDGICIKSGKDEEGRRRGMPTEYVIVDGCTVYSAHGGFVIGSEMSGGARNISVSNCQFIGTDNGLRFKSTRGRGGVVEKIYIRNISMVDIPGSAILFNLYYGKKLKPGEVVEPIPVDETTPSFRDISIENLSCRGAKQAFFFNGLPEMPVKNISLKNISISAYEKSTFNFCENITKENVVETLLK